MAATLQQKRASKIDTGNWTQLFSANLERMEESLKFVKQLLTVGVSNIMYLRACFPQSAFIDENLDRTPMKLLKPDSDCPEGNEVCQMIESAFEAIEKKYLRDLVLAIFQDPDKPEDAQETYTFHFDYHTDEEAGDNGIVDISFGERGPTSLLKSKNDLYESTVLLIRQILKASQSFKLLPDEAYLTMKLSYYDERTPADYEPPGFEKSDTQFKCDEEVQPLVTPEIKTKFHDFHVKIRSREFLHRDVQSFMASQRETQESQSPAQQQLDCACTSEGPQVPRDGEIVLHCRMCGSWQHGSCFLVFAEEQAPGTNHVCHKCCDSLPLATDRKLFKMMDKGKDVRGTCLYRRLLVFCVSKAELALKDIPTLLGIDADTADLAFDKLVSDGVVVPDEAGRRRGRINLLHLRDVVGPKFLGPKGRVVLQSIPSLAEKHSPSSLPTEGAINEADGGVKEGRKRKASVWGIDTMKI